MRFLPTRPKGWSLIELTIILIVLSILAAILAPVIGRYAALARIVRCREDVQAIGNVIQLFLHDTASSHFHKDGSAADPADNRPPDQSAANRVGMLVTAGDTPEVFANLPNDGVNTVVWQTAPGNFGSLDGGNVVVTDFLEYHIATNEPFADPDNAYRTPLHLVNGNPAQVFAYDGHGGFNSEFAWRGPYMTAPIDPDPWGNRYAANVRHLDPRAAVAAPFGGFTEDVIVLSAGPDEEIETPFARDGVTPGDDDIVYVVAHGSE